MLKNISNINALRNVCEKIKLGKSPAEKTDNQLNQQMKHILNCILY